MSADYNCSEKNPGFAKYEPKKNQFNQLDNNYYVYNKFLC